MVDTLNVARAGIGNVGSYQVSGWPFLTGSTLNVANFAGVNSQVKITFPVVCKSLTIVNTTTSSASLRVHFNSLVTDPGVINGHHYMTLTGSSTAITLAMKCAEVYVSLDTNAYGNGSFELFAEMTNISAKEMYGLTGSGLTA